MCVNVLPGNSTGTRCPWPKRIFGVTLVVSGNVSDIGLNTKAISFALLALFSIAAGTLYQKCYCGGTDFRTGGAVQYTAAGLVLFAGALASESADIR